MSSKLPASLDSTAQTSGENGGSWQEEVYQKLKSMKDLYYADLNVMYQKISNKLQQHDSVPQQPKIDQVEKLRVFKHMLERLMQVLQITKNDIILSLREKLPSFEKQIVSLLNSNRPRKPITPGQLGQTILPQQNCMYSQIPQAQSHDGGMNPQLQTLQSMDLPASLDITAQTSSANGGDWQEEVYQKIKSMRDLYYADLNEMYQKISIKLQQHDSVPQQPKIDQIEKLRKFKHMFEKVIQFLQITKNDILPVHREKLPSFEKQIISLLNTSSPRKPVPSVQLGQTILPQAQSQSQSSLRPSSNLDPGR